MTDTADTINDVVSVLRGGAEFYREGADKVKNQVLANLFRDNAAKRDEAAADLAAEVAPRGDKPAEGSWAEKAHSWYAGAKAMFQDADDAMIAQLEEHEDRTLKAFRDAIKELGASEPQATAKLTKHLAVFQATHEKMRALKKAA